MINEIIDVLFKESLSFMEETYNDEGNRDFRNHKDAYIKACILFNDYALQLIDIDFDKKGVVASGVGAVIDSKTRTERTPIDAYYVINNGALTLGKLLAVYAAKHKKVIAYVDGGKLLIKGNINKWFNIESISHLDANDVVSSVIEGGEEKIKKLMNELNAKIFECNQLLFKKARTICSN